MKSYSALAGRELFTAVVGDAMDKLGLVHQFLPPRIRPLRNDMITIGRAMPVLERRRVRRDFGAFRPMSKPFGLMLEALDDLRKDEVYICAGGSPRYALWGELMSLRAKRLGAAGAVMNGYFRDMRCIAALDFPTFGYARTRRSGPAGEGGRLPFADRDGGGPASTPATSFSATWTAFASSRAKPRRGRSPMLWRRREARKRYAKAIE